MNKQVQVQIHWTDHDGRWQYRWEPAEKIGVAPNGRVIVIYNGTRVLKSPLDVRS